MVCLQTPLVLVFAANPMIHYPIKTVVDGAVLSRSPHLRPDTATLEDHANSLYDVFLLESETSPPQTSDT